MLQLPTPAPRRARFSSADIDEMSRGAKVRVKPKPKNDPIIAMVARADRLLAQYINAVNAAAFAKMKLPTEDRGYPAVGITEDMINLHWSSGFLFTSERHIDTSFRIALAQARQVLADSQQRLKTHRPGHGVVSRLELEERITAETRRIRKLREFRAPMKELFRKKQARLLKAQNKVGLVVARMRVRATFASLKSITAKIATKEPITLEGAIAVASYVEKRLWCQNPQYFRDDGDMPGYFGQLMHDALKIIQKHANQGL